MVKYLASFFALSFITAGAVLSQAVIDIKMDLPSEVEAGKSFIVNINIHKGSLEEFSRFQQELPAGLTAEQVNSATADYGFENQRLRFIWLKMPPDELISISYRINVHQRLKGTFTLNGVFSYVEDNERKSIDVNSNPVKIIPSPLVAADKQIDIAEFTQQMAAEKSVTPPVVQGISCIRETPYLSISGNELMVNLLVYKKNLDRFARIEESIPAGFDVKSVVSNDAIFTFKDGIAKWVWMALPPGNGFTITYSLVPLREQTLKDLAIKGQFTYVDGGNNVSIDIVQKNVDLSKVDTASVDQMMTAINNGQAVRTQAVALPETIKPQASQVQEVTKTVPGNTGEQVRKTTEEKKTKMNIPAEVLLPVQDGIYYRVQIAAYRKLNAVGDVVGAMNLGKPVKIEYDEGLYKYTVGSFPGYADAQKYKDELVTSRRVTDAFVTAYRNGARIDVQQAMSLNGGM